MKNLFVSYVFVNGEGYGFGNTSILNCRKLQGEEELKWIQGQISEKYGHKSVAIINFRRME